MFDVLIHADWSKDPRKRWFARADRTPSGWQADGPWLVGDCAVFLDKAFADSAAGQSVLMGFDFPIGLPRAYGAKTGFRDFRQALQIFGTAEWTRVFDVAEHAHEVSLQRPFYPLKGTKGVRRAELVEGLGLADFSETLRACDVAAGGGSSACSMFWTLGGNQVGKAAIAGWLEVIRPGLASGARLWPFDGALRDLGTNPGVVLAESYPALAYAAIGAPMKASESKRRQADRRSKADVVTAWAALSGVNLSDRLAAQIQHGFGPKPDGEDPFDAVMGLFAMIEIADGRRPEVSYVESEIQDAESSLWEGWILGR